MTLLVVFAAGAALWSLSHFGAGSGAMPAVASTSFKTKQDYGLRDDPGAGSGVVVNLKAGSSVSGKPSQVIEGEQWFEVTTVDGTVGYMPASLLERFAGGRADAVVTGGLRSVEVNALVNLRQAPSLSAAIVGTADSGTRLTADGVVEAEGERWLRVPLTPDVTAFVLERYTQQGNDRVSEREFDQTGGNVGAPGTVRELTNLLSTPLPDARVLKALQAGVQVRVIGQTRSDRWWYVVLLDDGSQGFIAREAVAVSAAANRYVYADGTVAPGPTVRRADAEAMLKTGAMPGNQTGQADGRRNSAGTSASGDGFSVQVSPEAERQAQENEASGEASADGTGNRSSTSPAPPAPGASEDTGVVPEPK